MTPIRSKDVVKAPSSETRRNAEARLRQIAEQSDQERAEVIEALIKVVRDPEAKREWPIAHRWILAVDLLGYLRATEAIGVLISNLDHTGENGITSSLNFAPVKTALVNIGKVAVPDLIQAFISDEEEIRFEAVHTLAGIGKPALRSLVEALSSNQPLIKVGAARAVSFIGGKDAMQALAHAIEIEKEEQVRRQLQDALTELERRSR